MFHADWVSRRWTRSSCPSKLRLMRKELIRGGGGEGQDSWPLLWACYLGELPGKQPGRRNPVDWVVGNPEKMNSLTSACLFQMMSQLQNNEKKETIRKMHREHPPWVCKRVARVKGFWLQSHLGRGGECARRCFWRPWWLPTGQTPPAQAQALPTWPLWPPEGQNELQTWFKSAWVFASKWAVSR